MSRKKRSAISMKKNQYLVVNNVVNLDPEALLRGIQQEAETLFDLLGPLPGHLVISGLDR